MLANVIQNTVRKKAAKQEELNILLYTFCSVQSAMRSSPIKSWLTFNKRQTKHNKVCQRFLEVFGCVNIVCYLQKHHHLLFILAPKKITWKINYLNTCSILCQVGTESFQRKKQWIWLLWDIFQAQHTLSLSVFDVHSKIVGCARLFHYYFITTYTKAKY